MNMYILVCVLRWSSHPKRWMWQRAPTCCRAGRDAAATRERPHHVWGRDMASQKGPHRPWTGTGGCPGSPAGREKQVVGGCELKVVQINSRSILSVTQELVWDQLNYFLPFPSLLPLSFPPPFPLLSLSSLPLFFPLSFTRSFPPYCFPSFFPPSFFTASFPQHTCRFICKFFCVFLFISVSVPIFFSGHSFFHVVWNCLQVSLHFHPTWLTTSVNGKIKMTVCSRSWSWNPPWSLQVKCCPERYVVTAIGPTVASLWWMCLT